MIPAHYIHDLSPVLIQFTDRIALRWYGLAYLGGAWGGYLLLRYFSRKGWFAVPEKEVADFVTMLVLFGVLLGGRLGHILFYDDFRFLHDPLRLFRVWEGGMASHGGMAGIGLFLWFYAKKKSVSFLNLVDNVVAVVPLGLFLGRMANFINGELWGRVTDLPWGVVFPGELQDVTATQAPSYLASGLLFPRHPSQLYEAFGEGLLLLVILLLLRAKKTSQLHQGLITTVFIVLYAFARFIIEFFRAPDPGYELFWGWMTKGQAFSIAMLLVAVGVVLHWKKQCIWSKT